MSRSTLRRAAALSGLATVPARASEHTDMAALAKGQNGNGPRAGGGYDNGLNQNNSCDGPMVAGDFGGDGRSDIGVLYGYGRQDRPARARLYEFPSTGSNMIT
ncbi:hypothetical protein [Streptomyces sp. SCL15-4]|uniref:hypothetical protein n=1 Tax=Streptomyces sp. SCL15-4 TaxID=2967221 RepID=UPI002967064C|nr:hypothetical protein [Streptomyces sp. SCL15-4]